MKTGGHWWCDQCDEPAFGASCQHCHRDARFVPDAPCGVPPTKTESPGGRHAVTVERGHELFNQLRQKLNLL